jgi:hypothetical protein
MKSSTSYHLALCAGIAFALGVPSSAQDKSHLKTEPAQYKASVEGLVRDVACPIQNHKSTATDFNLECALACARSGSPLIILTQRGDIYFPISDTMPDPDQHAKLMPFVGKFVSATGTVYTRNGTRSIVIDSIKERKDVKLKTKDSGD